MLLASQNLAGEVLEVVDIITDDVLISRWSDKIPVVDVCGTQLVWPFDDVDVVELLNRE